MSFTPTIERRFRHMFRFYDLNKDGRLDSKDQYDLIQKLSRLYKSDTADTVKKEAEKWWAMKGNLNPKGSVTEEEYVISMRFLFEKDFTKFRKMGFKLYEATFSLIDHDKDNKISLDELVNFYACCNVTDTDRVKKIFKKLDLDKDGFVTRDEWILARLDYATRDDPDHDFGFMMDFSSSIPENSSSGRLTPNLLQRYKMAFRFYDINKDGVHTLADYLLVLNNICTLYNGGKDERAALQRGAMEWWKQLEPMAVDGKITEEHFAYRAITNLVTDFDKMRSGIVLNYRSWFNVADHNGDGLISKDEFLNFYAACNVKDEEKVKNIFKRLDLDDDGFVSEEEWILANLDYWTRDDSRYDYGFLYDVE